MTNPLQRRELLGLSAATTAALSLPRWIADAFRQDPVDGDEEPKTDVRDAWSRAKRAGKALLVIVVPDEPADIWKWGEIWGDVLSHGSDELLADLGLVDVYCAPMSAVRKQLSEAYEWPEGSPLGIVIETDRYELQSVAAPGAETPVPVWEQDEAAFEKAVLARVAEVEKALRSTLAIDRKGLERRAAQVRASFDTQSAKRGRPESAERAEARALVLDRLAAEDMGKGRAKAIEELARRVATRLRKAPPEGAKWARQNGCAGEFEDGKPIYAMIACGMGHVPQMSRRFLWFLAQESPF